MRRCLLSPIVDCTSQQHEPLSSFQAFVITAPTKLVYPDHRHCHPHLPIFTFDEDVILGRDNQPVTIIPKLPEERNAQHSNFCFSPRLEPFMITIRLRKGTFR
jgi:hypothetical protein